MSKAVAVKWFLAAELVGRAGCVWMWPLGTCVCLQGARPGAFCLSPLTCPGSGLLPHLERAGAAVGRLPSWSGRPRPPGARRHRCGRPPPGAPGSEPDSAWFLKGGGRGGCRCAEQDAEQPRSQEGPGWDGAGGRPGAAPLGRAGWAGFASGKQPQPAECRFRETKSSLRA